jgi:DNA-binding NtrC family response regulator
MAEGESILTEDLPVAVQASVSGGVAAAGHAIAADYRNGEVDPPTLEQIEKRALIEALEATGYNHTRAAMKLGITRRTLGYRLDKYNLPRQGRPGRRARREPDEHEQSQPHRSEELT